MNTKSIRYTEWFNKKKGAHEITVCGTAVCAIHHIVDLLYHKRWVSQKVFYFTPSNVLCRWIKLEFINCIKMKIWCVTRISYLQLVCKCKLFFFVLFCFSFVFLLRVDKCFLLSDIVSWSVWQLKNRSVWISVLCRHKFHLLQINSSKIIVATAVLLFVSVSL